MSDPTCQDAVVPCGERFVLGCDHAGHELKERVKAYLLEKGNQVEDLTPQVRDRVDFPPVAEQVAERVAARGDCYGVLVCGTGLGMSMAANKVAGIRAAVLYSEVAAQYARRHNDANVLAFGGRTMTFEQVRSYLEAFFSQRFEGGRYAARNQYIGGMEKR